MSSGRPNREKKDNSKYANNGYEEVSTKKRVKKDTTHMKVGREQEKRQNRQNPTMTKVSLKTS